MALRSLHISNVVLIDQLTLEIGEGLTALTGETGAGKSILLDSLGLVTGARADANLVRKNQTQASVTAVFENAPPVIAEILSQQGFEIEDDMVLRRVLSADGKSRAFINDQPVSVSLLRQIGEHLVDIHGQFETYGLLDPAQHGALLDVYAGLEEDCAALQKLWTMWKQASEVYDTALTDLESARKQEDYVRHAVDDLAALNPQEGEEDELLSIRQKLQHRHFITESRTIIENLLSGDDGIMRQLHHVWRQVDKLSDKLGADNFTSVRDSLDHAQKYLEQAERDIGHLTRDDDDDYTSLESVDDRLHDLRSQARRHNITCAQLPEFLHALRAKLDLMDHDGARLTQLEQNVTAAKTAWHKAAQNLSAKRQKAAKILAKNVNAELPPLKLEKAKFQVTCTAQENEKFWGPRGCDQIIFEVSTNGGDFGPLNKVASGGEMARFMLALKLVLAESHAGQKVYVFDEIDTGIGGSTAAAVGERLARLARIYQVLVVTHSPQVAATAHHHFNVAKDTGKTEIRNLDFAAKIEELARMLAGAVITDEARAAAQKLLQSAAQNARGEAA